MTVWIPLLVAVVTGAFALGGQALLAKSNNQKLTQELFNRIDKQSELSDQKIQGQIDVIKTEIKTLSDRVQQHNNLIDRMYRVEAKVTELEHNAEREGK